MNLARLHSLTNAYEDVQRLGLKLTIDSRIDAKTINVSNTFLTEKWTSINDDAIISNNKLKVLNIFIILIIS